MKLVVMVGWSGAGSFEDLERTALHRLGVPSKEASRIGNTLLVTNANPIAAARSLALLPGVAWIAAGHRFGGFEGYLKELGVLAKRYLSKGRSFRVSAQAVRSKRSAGDLVLAGNSELLSIIDGSKVDERKPNTRFRVALDGAKGACGVEIRAGPGGAATGDDWVSCLVSGGERSSSMAWLAALSGFSIRLVHSWTDEAALRCVTRLYSELSYRMDPRALELVVLRGGKSPQGKIGRWLAGHKGPVFAGLRPEHPDALAGFAGRFPGLSFPLLLIQDDSIGAVYRSLGIGRAPKAGGGLTLKALEAQSPFEESKFVGLEADSNTVIDAIKRGR